MRRLLYVRDDLPSRMHLHRGWRTSESEIEKLPERFDIDMMRCIYCGFCVDACPEEAIVMSREHHQAVYNRSESIYNIEKLMQRPGIDAKGPGYRPNIPFAEAKIFDPKTQKEC